MATKNVPDLNPERITALVLYVQTLVLGLRAQGLLLHRDFVVETQLVTEGSPANLAAVAARANALKAAMNLHLASTAHHIAADATNVITSPDAGAADQAAANTLLNEIKTDLNAHQLAAGGFHDVGALDGAVGAAAGAEATANATDLATSQALAASLSAMWNRHIRSGAPDLSIVPS